MTRNLTPYTLYKLHGLSIEQNPPMFGRISALHHKWLAALIYSADEGRKCVTVYHETIMHYKFDKVNKIFCRFIKDVILTDTNV